MPSRLDADGIAKTDTMFPASTAERRVRPEAFSLDHSHSIVPGGFDVTS